MARISPPDQYFLPIDGGTRTKIQNEEKVTALLNKCKVTQLKVLLVMYNLPKTGLKKDLIAALERKWKELAGPFTVYNTADLTNKYSSGAAYFYYILFVIYNFPDDYNTFIPKGEIFYQCCVEAPNASLAVLFARALIKSQKCLFATLNRKIFPSVTSNEVGSLDSGLVSQYTPQRVYGQQMHDINVNRAGSFYQAPQGNSAAMPSIDTYNNETLALLDNFGYIQSPFFIKTRSIKRQLLSKSYIKKVEIIKFQLSQSDIERLNRTSNENFAHSYELLLYCAPIKSMMSKNEYISFPSPIEIKINNNQVSDYIRGIKNKPETAQPARLTDHVIKEVLKDNTIQITFLRTNFQYVCNVYLVKSFNGLQLYNRAIKINEHIDKPTTILKAQKILNEDDEELQMETMRMSLQCPISYCRMKFPVRSKYCDHIQCFDAQWYLEAQRQVPLWECPVCQEKIKISDIRICDYTTEILNNCKNDNDEQVEIRKDGSYKYLENNSDGMGDSDSDSDGNGNGNGESGKTYFKNESPKKKSELEPEVIVLISSEDEDDGSAGTAAAVNSNQASANAGILKLPVLNTAESEEIVGNIAPEPQENHVSEQEYDEDEEMPSLRNDGRDLTASLANHFNLNVASNNENVDGNENNNFSPITQASSSTQTVIRPNNNNSSMTPIDGTLTRQPENLRKRRASTELARDTFIDLTGDD